MPNPTYKDLYELVDSRTNEVLNKMSKLDGRISSLEVWRGEISGRIAVLGAFIVFATTFAIDWIKSKVKFL